MKKIAFIAVFAAIILSWGKIHAFITAPPDFSELHDENVILYATSWCPNCAKTRKLLNAKNIPYFEYNVDNSSEGQRQFKQLHGNGVPVILIKKTVVRGYNQNAILAAVDNQNILKH